MTPREIENKAFELFNWVQSAVEDIAEGMSIVDRETAADEAYENPDILGDLYADKIHDEAKGDYADMVKIAERIIKITGHGATAKALNSKITKWKTHVG